MVYTRNPSTWEVETGRSRVQGLSYTVSLRLAWTTRDSGRTPLADKRPQVSRRPSTEKEQLNTKMQAHCCWPESPASFNDFLHDFLSLSTGPGSCYTASLASNSCPPISATQALGLQVCDTMPVSYMIFSVSVMLSNINTLKSDYSIPCSPIYKILTLLQSYWQYNS